ncbi:hypothetical protein CPR19088_GLDEOEPO_00530 [Companilactobacillus paralimentarius]
MSSSDSGVRALALTPRTYFEIRELCEAQNRASRPWLEAVPQQDNSSLLPEATLP